LPQERENHAQRPGIFMLGGAEVPHADSGRRLPSLNTACVPLPLTGFLFARARERGQVGVMFPRWTLFLFLTLSVVRTASAKSFILYVATNGNNGWSGRLEKPARDGQDGPLATLPAALKAARVARQSSKQTFDQAAIFLR